MNRHICRRSCAVQGLVISIVAIPNDLAESGPVQLVIQEAFRISPTDYQLIVF
jgi:hypothetical protein